MLGRPFITALWLALFACGTGCEAPLDGPKLSFRLEAKQGTAASSAEVARAVQVLARRLEAFGLPASGVRASATAGQVDVALPELAKARLDEVRAVAERPGTLEFRICAPPEVVQEFRREHERTRSAGPPAESRSELSWVLAAGSDTYEDQLVETPERPIQVEIERLSAKDPNAAGLAELKQRLDAVIREQVFRAEDVASARAVKQMFEHVLQFAMRDDRRSAFEDFTGRNVNRQIAIILDGTVKCAPTIKSKLPGEGTIQGGGVTGFTQRESEVLAAVLGAGAMPGRLVFVSEEAPK
jgi:preprotein translocase subunit SecD